MCLCISFSPPLFLPRHSSLWLWASLLAAALRFQSWLGKQMRSKQSVRQTDSQSDSLTTGANAGVVSSLLSEQEVCVCVWVWGGLRSLTDRLTPRKNGRPETPVINLHPYSQPPLQTELDFNFLSTVRHCAVICWPAAHTSCLAWIYYITFKLKGLFSIKFIFL